MKRVIYLLCVVLVILVSPVTAEQHVNPDVFESPQNPALNFAMEIEQYLQGSYSTVEVAALYNVELAEDYHLIERSDEAGRSYILACRKASAPPLPEGVIAEEKTSGGWGEPLNTLAWRLGVSNEDGNISGGALYTFTELTDALIESSYCPILQNAPSPSLKPKIYPRP
ncbi:MAG: hypothetical protein Q4D04_02170 [Clostridia bacterium]|nr:hypothetical protein [Clostridia bacterium]